MNSPRPPEEAIFEAALEKPTPEERSAYVTAACGTDDALHQRVKGLLDAYQQAGEFLEKPPAAVSAQTFVVAAGMVSAAEKTGDRIGRYKLLQEIGEGGCGLVWMAEQEEPVRRRVALKIIKLGMDTKQVVARFEAERQALALMDHPNIAKVLDAGATETGRPFFVMELVRGIKITDYCDQNNLSTEERLKLFIPVCQAVQHAHQKGIIHRDIKPSNILVTLHDGTPVPKVIDFGIAKATTDQRLTDKTIFTAFEQFIGTPAYMSPEQAEMSGLDIDTRTDIYGAGVLLYELLTGKTPFEPKELLAAGMDEMRRTIREKEPARPSTRLSTMLNAALADVAKHRHSEAPKLISLIRGDLDWIVMKCLEKDRTRRYETVNALAMDIQRHLNNEPVMACPPSNLYRFQKLVRRNRVAFAAGTAVGMTLLIGLVVSTFLFVQERQAHARALAAEHEQSRLRQLAEQAQFEAGGNARLAQAEAQKARRNQYAADMFATQYAIADGNLGRARTSLREYILRPDEEDLRGFEWRYWQAISQGRQSKTLHGHSHTVYAVVWSPDGRMIASGSRDGTVRLWDAGMAETIAVLKAHHGGLNSVAFSPDGRILATAADDDRLHLWDIENRLVILTITNSSPRALFSPKDNLLAMGTGGNTWGNTVSAGAVELRDFVSGQLVRRLPESGDRAVFSPNGSRLATANGQSGIVIWDMVTGQEVKTFPILRQVLCLAFSPDSRVLAFGTLEGGIELWDLQDERPSLLRKPTGDFLTCVSFSPDGRMLAASLQSHELELWDITERRKIDRFFSHAGEVWSVAFSPDGRMLASGGQNGEVMLWNPAHRIKDEMRVGGSSPFSLVHRYMWLGHPVLSPESRTLAVGDRKGHVQLLDAVTLQPHMVLTNAGKPVTFSANGVNLLTRASQFKRLQLWDITNGKLVSNVPTSLETTNGFAATISADQTFIAVVSEDGLVQFVDTRTGKLICELNIPIMPRNLELSPDGHTLAIGGEVGVAELWDVTTKRMLWRLKSHKQAVSVVTFSPDGKYLVTGSWDSTLKLWSVTTGQELATLSGHKAGVVCCAFSKEGRTLVSASDDHTIKFWNLPTFREVASFPMNDAAYLLKFSADGRTMLSGTDYTLRLWRAQSFSEIAAADRAEASQSKELPASHTVTTPHLRK